MSTAPTATDPKSLSKEDQRRLLECTQDLFGEDDGARERAALALVDFGAPGAMAAARILADRALCKHRKGVWALLHTVADLLSLEVPRQIEADLIAACVDFLVDLRDNEEYVGWMVADTLATHARESDAGPGVDQVHAGFLRALRSPHALPQLGAIYGLAAMAMPEARADLVEAEGALAAAAVEDYLARVLRRLEAGEPPEVFEDPNRPAPDEAIH